MKTKIIASTLFLGLVTTTVFAYNNNMGNMQQGMQGNMNSQMMNQGTNSQNMHNGMNQSNNMQGQQNMMNNMQNMMNNMHNMMHSMMNNMPNNMNAQSNGACFNNQQNGMHGQANMMGNMNGMMGNGMMHNNNMMHNNMPIFSKLNLSDDQKNKLSSLHKEMHNKMQTVMHPNNSHGMLEFITKDGFDKESFKKTMDSRHQNMMDFKIDHMDKVLKILTKEQLSQLTK